MSNYTGPVSRVIFVGTTGKPEFAVDFHVNADDPKAIEQIVARYAEDGYKPDQKRIQRLWMANGSLEERAPKLGPIGFRQASAFLRP